VAPVPAVVRPEPAMTSIDPELAPEDPVERTRRPEDPPTPDDPAIPVLIVTSPLLPPPGTLTASALPRATEPLEAPTARKPDPGAPERTKIPPPSPEPTLVPASIDMLPPSSSRLFPAALPARTITFPPRPPP
jgi:hypothetical protein